MSNWPGTLKFRVRYKRVGSHNLAGRRVDVWFTDSDGREWHGINYGHNSQLCHCRRLARHDANFRARFSALPVTREALPARGAAGQDRPHAPGPVVLPTCCAAGRLPTCCPWCCRRQLPAGCPTLPAGHSGSVAGPWCCPVKIGPTLPARGAADVLRCRPVADVLPVVLPAGQLPAGCPTLPAGHSGSVAGPVVLPGQDRPHAPGPVVLPTCRAAGRLPTCCPWCCCRSTPGRLPHAPGRSLGKRCRPVVLPGQDRPHAPGPWCCRRAALPAGCRRAARGAAGPSTPGRLPPRSRPVTRGSVAGPWCCPVKIGPTLPAPWCCRRAALPAGCRRAARGAAGRSTPGRLPPRSRPVTREALPAPWCCPVKIGPTLPARGAADVLCCRPVNSRPVAPTLPAGHSGSVAGPVVLPVKIGPTLPAPWCCRRAALPAGCRRAARGAACPSTPGRLPHAPGRSLGKRCRPRGAARSRSAPRSRPRGAADVLRSRPVADVLPVVLPARQLPAGCPTLPAGHSGSVAGPVVLPVKIGPTLPAPWCCRRAALPAGCRRAARGAARPVNSRPVAPRSRPVTREALPAPWCCPVKIGPTLPAPWCCRRAALPAGCRRAARGAAGPSTPGRLPHAPGRSLGSVAGPWCCRCVPCAISAVLVVTIVPDAPARSSGL